jgi:hypothetical protein
MSAHPLDEAERRRRELEQRVAALQKENQARRMLLALRADRAGTVVVLLALVLALAVGAAVGGTWLGRTERYLRVCTPSRTL